MQNTSGLIVKETRLKLTIEETKIETRIIIEILPTNKTEEFTIILPFPVNGKKTVFPMDAICSSDVINNKYTFLSVLLPEQTQI